jgi:hypothetical protein
MHCEILFKQLLNIYYKDLKVKSETKIFTELKNELPIQESVHQSIDNSHNLVKIQIRIWI